MEALAVPSIALQLIDKIKEVHDFWSSLKDAPDDIRTIVRDLKSLSDVLEYIRDDVTQHGPDQTIGDLLDHCEQKVNSWKKMVEHLEQGLRSSSRRARSWSSFRTVLRDKQFKKFYESLQDTKITLLLAQQRLNRQIIQRQYDSHTQDLSSITQEIAGLKLQYASQTISTTSIAAQPDIEHHLEAIHAEIRRMASTIPNRIIRAGLISAIRQVSEQTIRQFLQEQNPIASGPEERHEADINGVTDNGVPSRRHSGCQRRKVITHCNSITTKTIFGTIFLTSETFIIRHGNDHCDDDSMLDEDDFERKTSFRVHPASWLLQLGLSYGLRMTLSRSIQGWKHALDTYRAVPDDSEIFKHCENGNLRDVKILLSMGKASVWDSDTYGRTPLHFAARSWQFEVCEALLDAGASVSARTATIDESVYSTNPCTPLDLAAEGSPRWKCNISSDEDLENTIRLLLDRSEFLEESDSFSILHRLLMESSALQGPACKCWVGIINGSHKSLCRAHQSYINTLTWIIPEFRYQMRPYTAEDSGILLADTRVFIAVRAPKILDLLLETGNITIDDTFIGPSVLHWPMGTEGSCETMKNLIRRGANLHLLTDYKRPETPLSLALSTSAKFHFWRKALQESNVNMDDYIARACQEPPLIEDGWTEISLQALFQYSSYPVIYVEDERELTSIRVCPCCGFYTLGAIETRWQRALDKIKAGQELEGGPNQIHHHEVMESVDAPIDEDDGEWEDIDEKEGEVEEDRLWQDQYDFLCKNCWEDCDQRDPCNRSRWIREPKDSSDEEDSPFLLPLPM